MLHSIATGIARCCLLLSKVYVQTDTSPELVYDELALS